MESTEPFGEEAARPMSGSLYESLCLWMYMYRFGTISFLELLNRFEEALGIQPPRTDCHNHLKTKE
jgi:hypothetical protein